jgi:predicted nucleic acid-binding protein
MRLIVADTSPLVYLVLIDHIDILPQLFENHFGSGRCPRGAAKSTSACRRPGLGIGTPVMG